MNLNRLNAQEDGHWLLLWTNELQCPWEKLEETEGILVIFSLLFHRLPWSTLCMTMRFFGKHLGCLLCHVILKIPWPLTDGEELPVWKRNLRKPYHWSHWFGLRGPEPNWSPLKLHSLQFIPTPRTLNIPYLCLATVMKSHKLALMWLKTYRHTLVHLCCHS